MSSDDKLEFESLSFQEDKEAGVLIVRLYKTFRTSISLALLKKIGLQAVQRNSLTFSKDGKPQRFYHYLDEALLNLEHSITRKKAFFISEASGIPLIGSQEFGVIDRDTNILEIRPLTGCNLACIFCSVDEGPNNKEYDYVVAPEYLAKETEKLASLKHYPVEVQYGPVGEPLLYTPIIELTKMISKIKNVKEISIKTNGVNLNKKLIDELSAAGMTRLNVSLNATNQELATKLAGKPYPVEHVMKMCEYAANTMDVIIAPTIVPGFNDEEIPNLAAFGKKLTKQKTMGFQNFLQYKRGRNPAKERSFEEFFTMLKPFEDDNFILTPKKNFNPFNIHEDKTLEKTMKKGDILKVELIGPGRYPNEKLAVSQERVITVITEKPLGSKLTIKIVRDKHNIYVGAPA